MTTQHSFLLNLFLANRCRNFAFRDQQSYIRYEKAERAEVCKITETKYGSSKTFLKSKRCETKVYIYIFVVLLGVTVVVVLLGNTPR